LIDLLATYKDIFPSLPKEPSDTPPAGVGTESSAEIAARRRARALRIAEALSDVLPPLAHVLIPIKSSTPNDGALWLLSAGARTGPKFNTYAETVQDFDWEQFYAAYEGEAYFEWFRRQLLKPDVADIVLIDSRTGVAEMSGACTRQMADVIVMLCAPNDQNLDGVERMAESFIRPAIIEARGGRAIDLIMAAARVDITEGKPVDVFMSNFRAKLDPFAPAFLKNLGVGFSKLRIPYVRAYAYGDRLAIGEPDGVESMQEAYTALAAHIAALAPPASRIRTAARDAIAQTFGLPTVAVLPIGEQAAAVAADIQARLEGAGTLTISAETLDGLLDPNLQRHGPGGGPVPVVVAVKDAATVDRRVRDVCRRASEQGIRAVVGSGSGVPVPADARPRWLQRAGVFDVSREFDGLLKTVLSRSRVGRTPFTAPPVPEEFVDRAAEVERIRHEFVRRGDGDPPGGVALAGRGGIGKSAIAAAVCHDDAIVDFFDDGIVWASFGPGANLLDVYSRLVAAFSGDLPSFHTAEEAKRALAELLATRRCLVVMDDVWDTSQLLQGRLSDSRVLLTTRSRDVAAEAGTVVSIGPLPGPAAAELLDAHLPALDMREVERLARKLDDVPLALRQANRIIRTRIDLGDQPQSALLKFIAEYDQDGLAALDVGDTQEQGSSIVAVFRSSAERLTPTDRGRLPRLARLDADVPLPLDDVAVQVGLSTGEAEAMFRRLASASLIEFDAAESRVRVPHLSRRFFQTLEEREKQSEAPFAAAPRTERPRIFISYDRRESERYASKIADRLTRHFGYENVFLDVSSIAAGSDFVREVEGAIGAANVVVALIGPLWTAKLTPSSFVVNELTTAFQRGITVIPVLIDDATMPPAEALPAPLDRLARIQALVLDQSRFQSDMDLLIKTIDNLTRTKEPLWGAARGAAVGSPRRAAGRRTLTRVAGIAAAAMLILAAGAYIQRSVQRATLPDVAVAPALPVMEDERIGRAFQSRQAGDVDTAIALLTGVLGGTATPAVRAKALRDRAYCYKLQKDWTSSIADLSTALALSASAPSETATVLTDRANAYLEIPDIDAALADYDTLVQLVPGDRDGIGAREALRAFLKPTQGVLFVFAPNGVVNSAAELPVAVQKLDEIGFLNLRFWWHDIPATEVRYTAAADEKTTRAIVERLHAAGVDVKGPTLLSSTVARSHRIEVWLRIPVKKT
jgi:tetratricopeptide (TPR) repeat protein